MMALLNPWAILGALAAAAASFLAGMHLQTQLFEAANARQLQQQIEQIAEFGTKQRKENAAIAARLTSETAKRRTSERKLAAALRATPKTILIESVCTEQPRATPEEMAPTALAKEGGRPARILADGVRLWNERLALAVSLSERGPFIDGTNAEAGPVEIEDAIQNVADNAAILGECRGRELAWQTKACQNKWYVGPECGG